MSIVHVEIDFYVRHRGEGGGGRGDQSGRLPDFTGLSGYIIFHQYMFIIHCAMDSLCVVFRFAF